MSREERAKEYFLQGYACSQAVALAFADLTGLDEATLVKLTLPFGGGMGRLRLTCGALSGMAAIVGLLFAKEENTAENKMHTYQIVQGLCKKFEAENGHLLCGDLLEKMQVPVEVGGVAEPRTKEYYQKRLCSDLVASAARILDEYVRENLQ